MHPKCFEWRMDKILAGSEERIIIVSLEGAN